MPFESIEPTPCARFSDGKTAAAVNAGVRLGERGVEISVRGEAPIVWPYATLTTAEPLTDHAIDALLNSSESPGATLFVADPRFARRLPSFAPHVTARATRWRHARPWVFASGAAAAVALLVWILELSPSHAIARLLPDRARATLGAEALRSMTAGKDVCRASKGTIALKRLMDRLSVAAGSGKFSVVVVDWGLLNAFAVPGEQIVLTQGLIAGAESPDEVAGVLAHEMGHGLEMHPETALVRAIGLAAATDLILGGSGGTIANIGLVLAQLSYTRAAEREADTHALAILRRAGIAADGLAAFFKRVAEREDRSPYTRSAGTLSMLRTHPVTDERQRLVESQPHYPASPSMTASDWQSLKAICEPTPEPDEI